MAVSALPSAEKSTECHLGGVSGCVSPGVRGISWSACEYLQDQKDLPSRMPAGGTVPSPSPSVPPAPELEPEQRSSTLQVVLLMVANLLFALLIGPVHGLAALDQDISEFNGEEMDSGWFLVWPGMLIVWGAAWLGFLVFALKNQVRSALITFNLIAALWLLPITLYVLSLIAGT